MLLLTSHLLMSGTSTVTVRILRTLPRPPKWTHLPPLGRLSVGQDAGVGTLIGSVKAVSQNSHGRRSPITYSIVPLAAVDSPFIVEASTGRLFLNDALNYERRRLYDITVVARDESSSLTAITTLHVEVFAPNIHDRCPRFVDPAADFRYRVESGARPGTVVFRASATGRGSGSRMRYSLSRQIPAGRQFSVDADSGLVTVAGALNARESAADTYRLTIAAVDQSLAASYRLTARKTFTVDIVSGAPEFLSPAAVLLSSSARPGALVTVVVAAAVGGHGARYSVSRGSSDSKMFRIDAATGRLYLRASLTGRAVYRVVVAAADSRNSSRSSSMRLSVIIRSPVPDSGGGGLVFSRSAYAGHLAENSPASTSVVSVAASYPRGGGGTASSRVEYYITSMTSPDSSSGVPLPNYFEVLPTSGLIRSTRALDREQGLGTFVIDVYAVDTSTSLATPRTRNVTVSIFFKNLSNLRFVLRCTVINPPQFIFFKFDGCKYWIQYRYTVFCMHICTVNPVKAYSSVVKQT